MVFSYHQKIETWVIHFSGEILGPSGAGRFMVILEQIDLRQGCTYALIKTMSKYSHRAACTTDPPWLRLTNKESCGIKVFNIQLSDTAG